MAVNTITTRIRIREGGELIDTRVFEPKPLAIGSGSDCDITLRDQRILARQVTLTPVPDGGWLIEARPEGAPTFLNGHRVTKATNLGVGDEIRICDFVLTLARDPVQRPPEPRPRDVVVPEEVAMLRAHPLPAGAVVRKPPWELNLVGSAPARLARFSLGLRHCHDIPKLIEHVLDTLLVEFAGRMAFVGTRRNSYGRLEFVQGRNFDGRHVDEPPMFETYVFRCLDRSQFIRLPSTEEALVGSVLATPLICDRGHLGLLYVDRKKDGEPFSENDLDMMATIAGLAAGQLESIVVKQTGVQEMIGAGQLAFIREIQTQMDPAKIPQWVGYQLAAYCKPGSDQSGDIFDVMRTRNGAAAILVANVSGNVLPTAIAMAQARAAFRSAGLHLDGPELFMRVVNWILCEDRCDCRMDAAAVIINPSTGDLQYCTAGEIGVLLVDEMGRPLALMDREVPAAGEHPGHTYLSRNAVMPPDATLALFTRGAHTVLNASGEPLGEELLTETICDGCGQSATTALEELVQDLAPFYRAGRQPDDITILLLHRAAVMG